MGGKFAFDSRFERFSLFDEFDCLHLLTDPYFALRGPDESYFESRKRERWEAIESQTRPPSANY
jgi:hypothetical protein